MHVLTLPVRIHHDLIERAIAGQPNEICGLLGGWNDLVTLHLPLPNVASDSRIRYRIAPQDLIRASYHIEKVGELVAIYHSHPASPPIPSATDIAEATWPAVAYLIIGFESDTVSLRAWHIRLGTVTEIDLRTTP